MKESEINKCFNEKVLEENIKTRTIQYHTKIVVLGPDNAVIVCNSGSNRRSA